MQFREMVAIVFDAPDEETAWRMSNIWNVPISR
jgi:hypothetical protein